MYNCLAVTSIYITMFIGYVLIINKIETSFKKYKYIVPILDILFSIFIFIIIKEKLNVSANGYNIYFEIIPIYSLLVFRGVKTGTIAICIYWLMATIFFGFNSTKIALVLFLIMIISIGIFTKKNVPKITMWLVLEGYNIIYFFIVSITKYNVTLSSSNIFIILSHKIIYNVLIYFAIKNIFLWSRALSKFKEEAMTDYLTGLLNTRAFYDKVNEIDNSARDFMQFSIILLDIDFFKKVNDTYGHKSGDIVLIDFAQILKRNTREDDIVARIGGEEFAIILNNTNYKKAIQVAERIRRTIENHVFLLEDGIEIKITASIGVSNYPKLKRNIKDVIISADKALYESKNSGRNKVSINI